MSIATTFGDTGLTGLIGGARVSKADLRVEAYGTIDETGAAMGFARSICRDEEINELTKSIQRELFSVAGSVANPRAMEKDPRDVSEAMIARLTTEVHHIEATDGILRDWSLPGDHAPAAAYDVARTICRRAERLVVHLAETTEGVDPHVIAYLNRLSDLLWLMGRLLELRAGIESKLRDDEHAGPKWSRAW